MKWDINQVKQNKLIEKPERKKAEWGLFGIKSSILLLLESNFNEKCIHTEPILLVQR